jgi:hypothetical protein
MNGTSRNAITAAGISSWISFDCGPRLGLVNR